MQDTRATEIAGKAFTMQMLTVRETAALQHRVGFYLQFIASADKLGGDVNPFLLGSLEGRFTDEDHKELCSVFGRKTTVTWEEDGEQKKFLLANDKAIDAVFGDCYEATYDWVYWATQQVFGATILKIKAAMPQLETLAATAQQAASQAKAAGQPA